MKWLILGLLLLLPAVARADWGVLPAASWAADATVVVVYELHDATATGPIIGTAQTLTPPSGGWSLTVPRSISTAPFAGTGRAVVLTAKAKRGTVESPVVSLPPTSFSLDTPGLSVLPVP